MRTKKPEPIQEAPFTLPMQFDEALERFTRINTRIEEPEAIFNGKATPFIKWAGGKRGIIQDLVSHLPATFNDYYEPFLGGGALYFEIQTRLTRAYLSDTNFDLVIAFKAVQKLPDELISKLEEHSRKDSEEYYYKIRAQHDLQNPIEIAARFIYLNKTCYNGLFRVNKKGEFNVPRGTYANPDIIQRDNISACSQALQNASIVKKEFDLINPNADDFVYFDPPYHPSDTTSFTKYTKLDFSEKDQERLRDFATKLNRNGVKVMLSNSDTRFIRNLYSANIWHIDTVQAPRMVNCKPDGRGVVNELLITNYVVEQENDD
jgi:DNA adenine methylase